MANIKTDLDRDALAERLSALTPGFSGADIGTAPHHLDSLSLVVFLILISGILNSPRLCRDPIITRYFSKRLRDLLPCASSSVSNNLPLSAPPHEHSSHLPLNSISQRMCATKLRSLLRDTIRRRCYRKTLRPRLIVSSRVSKRRIKSCHPQRRR